MISTTLLPTRSPLLLRWSTDVNFRIADTFTDSLARLTGDEQKAIKTTAFDLQLNPASPGMISESFHLAELEPYDLPLL